MHEAQAAATSPCFLLHSAESSSCAQASVICSWHDLGRGRPSPWKLHRAEGGCGVRRMPTAMLLFGMSLAWGVGAAAVARADPPQNCRELAVQFGTAPAQMDANSLATLGSCVMAEIQERSSPPSQPAPSEQQPQSPGNSPIDQPGWGQWSTPPPWSDSSADPQPWKDE